jgi:cytochrome c2
MLQLPLGLLAAIVAAGCAFSPSARGSPRQAGSSPATGVALREARTSPSDLEVGGELAGLPAGTTRYVTMEDLRTLPQVRYVTTNDPNFEKPTKIAGIALAALARELGADPTADLIVAICNDKYRANYTHTYIAAHRPVLAVEVNGKTPTGASKDFGSAGFEMGPFLVSQPHFVPGYTTLGYPEQPLIPWGVVRVEFRKEKEVLGAIAPRGPHAQDADIQKGFTLAEPNCYRCHNMGAEGGQKAEVPWTSLASMAVRSRGFFVSYVRDPQKLNPQARMEGTKDYNDQAMDALIAYFTTFETPGEQ